MTLGSRYGEAMTPDHQREQARVRQARHRRGETAARVELKAETEAEGLPLAWRAEFLDVVQADRVRVKNALAQVEKAALAFPEGEARQAYLRRNYPHTKVSVSRLLSRFVRTKKNQAEVVLYRDVEDDRAHDDFRPEIEDIDWDDLETVAWLLGDPSDQDLAAVQPTVRFIVSIVFASVSMAGTATGFAQAIELLRFLEEMRLRQIVAHSA